MTNLRGLTVCVGPEHAKLLAITLPRNMRHLAECWVATDEATKDALCDVPNVRLLVTDAFTRHGACFNKGLAVELLLDEMGRDGWIFIWDCDCVFPQDMKLPDLNKEVLHGLKRKILPHPEHFTDDPLSWRGLSVQMDGGPLGFSQIFHGEAGHLRGRRPWYDVSFSHAGGCDAHFMDLFPPLYRRVLDIHVLHLGMPYVNWYGTDALARERMDAFLVDRGWKCAQRELDPTIVDRVTLPGRVSVPGYPASQYKLPFVDRKTGKVGMRG